MTRSTGFVLRSAMIAQGHAERVREFEFGHIRAIAASRLKGVEA